MQRNSPLATKATSHGRQVRRWHDPQPCTSTTLRLKLQSCPLEMLQAEYPASQLLQLHRAATASAMHTHHPQLTLSWQSSTSLVSPVCLPSLPQTCAAPAQLCCRSKCRLRMPVPKCVRKLCSTMPIAYGRESPCTPSLPNSSFGSLCRKGAHEEAPSECAGGQRRAKGKLHHGGHAGQH